MDPTAPTMQEVCEEVERLARVHGKGGMPLPEVRAIVETYLATVPQGTRPTVEEVGRLVAHFGTVASAADPLAGAPPMALPAGGAVEVISERWMAERLASGSLPMVLRFLPEGPERGWRKWDESAWLACPDPAPREVAAAIREEVAALIRSNRTDYRTGRHLESTAAIRAIMTQLESYGSMRLAPRDMDPPYLIATLTGILSLKDGDEVRASPTSGPQFLRRLSVSYDPQAQDDLWDEVQAHILRQEAGETVLRFIGAALMGIPSDRKAVVMVGQGADGKSTIMETILALFDGFGTPIPAEVLAGSGRGAHGHELTSGLGVTRIGCSSEVASSLDWPLFKSLTGGDTRCTKRLHGRAYQATPRAWLVLAMNEEPRPPDDATADRIILARFNRPADPNPDIMRTLRTPGPERGSYLRAALRCFVEYGLEYRRFGLGIPALARPSAHPQGLDLWWAEKVAAGAIRPGRGWTPMAPLRASVDAWSHERGEVPPTETALGDFMNHRVGRERRTIDGKKFTVYGCSIASTPDRVGQG